MSFTTYLRQGVNLAGGAYQRFNNAYPQDQARPYRASYQYQGTVTHQETQGITSKRILDEAIEVMSVSDEIRAPKLAFWKKRSAQSLKLGIGGIGLTVTGIGAGVAAGTLLAGTLAIAAPVAAGAVAVAGIALIILGFYRRSQANEQYQAWQDPLPAYQTLRQQTFSKGFPHVFSSHLKGTLIHPEECRQLWMEWSDREMPFYRNIRIENRHSEEVLRAIKQFFRNNPLSAGAMQYAFEGVAPAPQNIQDLSAFYQQMETSYSNVRAEAEKTRQKIYDKKRRLISDNEAQRQAWLAPARLVRDAMIEEAHQQQLRTTQELRTHLDFTLLQINQRFTGVHTPLELEEKKQQIAKVKADYQNHPVVIGAEREYHSKYNKYQLLYNLAATPINLKFDANEQKIEKWAARQIRKVNEKENDRIGEFARDVQGVAQAYIEAKDYNKMLEKEAQQVRLYPQLDLYQNLREAYVIPPAYNPEFTKSEVNRFYEQIYQYPQPSAPPLDA